VWRLVWRPVLARVLRLLLAFPVQSATNALNQYLFEKGRKRTSSLFLCQVAKSLRRDHQEGAG
jgi:hypothetical protein